VALDATPRDWYRYTHHAVVFRLRNAQAWGNARTGCDLAAQIDLTSFSDPTFSDHKPSPSPSPD